jgi:hypothetical protein
MAFAPAGVECRMADTPAGGHANAAAKIRRGATSSSAFRSRQAYQILKPMNGSET